MNKELTSKELNKFKSNFNKSKYNKLAANVVQKNGVLNSALNGEAIRDLTPVFNIEVKDVGSVTNQKQSGRCWMFSGLNVVRGIVAKNLKVKDIELSENYLMFYDKLEKCNYQLEAAIDYIDEKPNSRQFDILGSIGGQNDGGFWHFFVDLVNKYGVCPKSVQEEVVASSASGEMDAVLNTLIVKDMATLRSLRRAGKTKDDLRNEKEGMLEEIYRVLAICLGTPVGEFVYEYMEDAPTKEEKEEAKEESKFRRIKTTPKDFAKKYLTKDLNDFVLLVNWPIRGYKTYEVYTIKDCYNVKGAPTFTAINVPIEEMKDSAIKAMKDNNPLWFGCDVGAESFRKEGYLAPEAINLNDLFSINLKFDKGDRLQLRASSCTHAMTLTGVNLDDADKPNRWKVQNSWGTDVGVKGIYIMSDRWFDEYVYEIVIDKKYLSDKVYKLLDKEPKALDLWEPVN